METTNVKVTSIAISEEVYRWLQKKSQEENRNLSNFIDTFFKKIMEKEKMQ